MKKIKLLPITLIAVAALVISSVAYASPAASQDFGTQLSGAQEVPRRDTPATGSSIFQLSEDGTALSYTVKVNNISNVFASHIHCGAKGVNGPVGVTLFMGVAGGGPVNGTLAKGTITAPDPGNACGWADLAAVVAAINTGNTYVNVHTNDGVAPTNTGAGDFPGGEIRGQLSQIFGDKTK
jgi:Cu/Zn superoxide dismutase